MDIFFAVPSNASAKTFDRYTLSMSRIFHCVFSDCTRSLSVRSSYGVYRQCEAARRRRNDVPPIRHRVPIVSHEWLRVNKLTSAVCTPYVYRYTFGDTGCLSTPYIGH
jgi:hypothetical protein